MNFLYIEIFTVEYMKLKTCLTVSSVRNRAEASEGSIQALINSEWMYDREHVHQGGPPGRGASQTCTGIACMHRYYTRG